MMQSGKLRHRFTIQTYTDTINDYGEDTPPQNEGDTGWTTFASRWGSLESKSVKSDERDLADRVQGKVIYLIGIRKLDGLLDCMRFKMGTRYFNIVKILPDKTDKKYQIIETIEKL